jgi:hypothetical protein
MARTKVRPPAAMKATARRVKPPPLNATQQRIAALIDSRPGVTTKEIAAALGLKPSTVRDLGRNPAGGLKAHGYRNDRVAWYPSGWGKTKRVDKASTVQVLDPVKTVEHVGNTILHLIGAIQDVHAMLCLGRPELHRARIEFFDRADSLAGWLGTKPIGRMEVRNPVTNKGVSCLAPTPDLSALRAKHLPSDQLIEPPTDDLRREIDGLLESSGLDESGVDRIFARYGVSGGAESIANRRTALRIRDSLTALLRLRRGRFATAAEKRAAVAAER